MSLDLGALLQDQQAFYEVWPYYVLLDEHPVGRSPVRRKVQAGFDVDLYAAGKTQAPHLVDGKSDVHFLAIALEEAPAKSYRRRKSTRKSRSCRSRTRSFSIPNGTCARRRWYASALRTTGASTRRKDLFRTVPCSRPGGRSSVNPAMTGRRRTAIASAASRTIRCGRSTP